MNDSRDHRWWDVAGLVATMIGIDYLSRRRNDQMRADGVRPSWLQQHFFLDAFLWRPAKVIFLFVVPMWVVVDYVTDHFYPRDGNLVALVTLIVFLTVAHFGHKQRSQQDAAGQGAQRRHYQQTEHIAKRLAAVGIPVDHVPGWYKDPQNPNQWWWCAEPRTWWSPDPEDCPPPWWIGIWPPPPPPPPMPIVDSTATPAGRSSGMTRPGGPPTGVAASGGRPQPSMATRWRGWNMVFVCLAVISAIALADFLATAGHTQPGYPEPPTSRPATEPAGNYDNIAKLEYSLTKVEDKSPRAQPYGITVTADTCSEVSPNHYRCQLSWSNGYQGPLSVTLFDHGNAWQAR